MKKEFLDKISKKRKQHLASIFLLVDKNCCLKLLLVAPTGKYRENRFFAKLKISRPAIKQLYHGR